MPSIVYKIGVLNLKFTDIEYPWMGFRVSESHHLYDKCCMCPFFFFFFLRIVSSCPQTFKGYLISERVRTTEVHSSYSNKTKQTRSSLSLLILKNGLFSVKDNTPRLPNKCQLFPHHFPGLVTSNTCKLMPQSSRDGLMKALKRWFIPLCTETNTRYLLERIVRIIHLAARSTMSAKRTK